MTAPYWALLLFAGLLAGLVARLWWHHRDERLKAASRARHPSNAGRRTRGRLITVFDGAELPIPTVRPDGKRLKGSCGLCGGRWEYDHPAWRELARNLHNTYDCTFDREAAS